MGYRDMKYTREEIFNIAITPKGRVYKKYLQSLSNEDKSFFNNLYNDSKSLEESIVRYAKNIDIRPICKTCGNEIEYCDGNFKNFCSRRCCSNNPEILERNRKSVSNSLKRAYKNRGDEIKKKRAKTLGLDENSSGSPFSSKLVQNKIKNVINKKFGVDNIFCLEEKHKKSKISIRAKSIELWKERGYNIEYNDNNIIIKNGCKIHGDIKLTLSLFANRMKPERRNIMCICPICNPPKSQTSSQEVKIKHILNELEIKYIFHDHKQIHPKELDFYLPDYRIGIECNGMYWHSVNWQQIYNPDLEKSHFDKRKICEEKGIKLLTFWENNVNHKEEQIKSQIIRILNLSDNINPERIERGTKTQCKNFIEENSLYKYIDLSGDNFLIYCEDEIVGEFSIVADTIVHFVEKNNISLNKYFIFKFIKEEFPNVKYFNINLDYDIYDRWKNWFIVKEEYLDSFYYNRLTSIYCKENNEDKTNIYKCFTSGTLKLEFK